MRATFGRSLLVITLAVLGACGQSPSDSAYLNRGGPESLLDVSSEVVNLSVASPSELKDLSAWIEKDQPTRAELNCQEGTKRCIEAHKVLDLYGVPTSNGAGDDQSVSLVYERILARDCSPKLEFEQPNYHNTNHAHFGCAVAANMVQSVTDKQSFVSPNLSDDPLATRAVNDMHRAYAPRDIVKPYSIDESVVAKGKTQ